MDQGPIDRDCSSVSCCPRMTQSRLAVAVVDDEESVRKALGRLLRASGFEVHTFATGLEFLDSLQKHLPDCAILDLHLPGLSGLDVQQRLTQQRIHLPCIVITGKDEPGVVERVLAAGAVAYLKKPLDERELLASIALAVPRQPEKKFDNLESKNPGMLLTDKLSLNGGHI